MNWYNIEYPVFFVVLAFVLAGLYTKDGAGGVNELTLSSCHGRKKDFKARWIAGNLFAVTTYLIAIGVLIAEHAAVASLHGWNVSAQAYWFHSLLNITVGMGLLMKLTGGLLGVLVIANAVMLLSVRTKNMKITIILSLLLIWGIRKGAATYSYYQTNLLYPNKFSSDAVIENFIFIGNTLVPYFFIVIILSVIYLMILKLSMRNSHKKYSIN